MKKQNRTEWVPAKKRNHDSQPVTPPPAPCPIPGCATISCPPFEFERLYHRYRLWALPLAWQYGAGDHAEILFHDSLLSLLRHHRICDPDFGQLLAGRLISRCKGSYRSGVKRRNRFEPLPEDFEDHWPGHSAEEGQTDLWVRLHELIGELGEAEQRMLRLYYWDNLPLTECVKRFKKSVPAGKAFIFRIRKKLRKLLRECEA
jgi:DNA-directed RNA polymerase specialized sigma24 family protein